MEFFKLGKNALEAEVQAISRNGIWLYVRGKEYFLPYKTYPWFNQAKVSEVYRLEFLQGNHLYWPDLDVDLELESLEHPEKYPLIANTRRQAVSVKESKRNAYGKKRN